MTEEAEDYFFKKQFGAHRVQHTPKTAQECELRYLGMHDSLINTHRTQISKALVKSYDTVQESVISRQVLVPTNSFALQKTTMLVRHSDAGTEVIPWIVPYYTTHTGRMVSRDYPNMIQIPRISELSVIADDLIKVIKS